MGGTKYKASKMGEWFIIAIPALHGYGKSTFFNGKNNYKRPFSIAMLNCQRVPTIKKAYFSGLG